MYLALSTQFNVEIASDTMDLLSLLDSDKTDFTFLDICSENTDHPLTADMINQITCKQPTNQIIGLCPEQDENIMQKAARLGIKKVLTKPIKNRELFRLIQA